MTSTEPALVVACGDETFTFDDDEYVALSEMNFLYGSDDGNIGRLLVARATLSEREVVQLQVFLRNVGAKLDEPLVVYDHGHGRGTVCFQHKHWYELVKKSGVRYQKPTPRYVKGDKGKLASIDQVVYVRGRSVTAKDQLAHPQTLHDVTPLVTALEKLGRAVEVAIVGASLSTRPREAYEYI